LAYPERPIAELQGQDPLVPLPLVVGERRGQPEPPPAPPRIVPAPAPEPEDVFADAQGPEEEDIIASITEFGKEALQPVPVKASPAEIEQATARIIAPVPEEQSRYPPVKSITSPEPEELPRRPLVPTISAESYNPFGIFGRVPSTFAESKEPERIKLQETKEEAPLTIQSDLGTVIIRQSPNYKREQRELKIIQSAFASNPLATERMIKSAFPLTSTLATQTDLDRAGTASELVPPVEPPATPIKGGGTLRAIVNQGGSAKGKLVYADDGTPISDEDRKVRTAQLAKLRRLAKAQERPPGTAPLDLGAFAQTRGLSAPTDEELLAEAYRVDVLNDERARAFKKLTPSELSFRVAPVGARIDPRELRGALPPEFTGGIQGEPPPKPRGGGLEKKP